MLMDIYDLTVFASYFVICSGTSERMLKTLADAAAQTVKDEFGLIARTEGDTNGGWILIDFGDVVVHLFSPDRRAYYRLEELWDQGKVLLHLQ